MSLLELLPMRKLNGLLIFKSLQGSKVNDLNGKGLLPNFFPVLCIPRVFEYIHSVTYCI